MGNAFSGGAAAEDVTTIFFNPAGLTRLSGSSVNAAVYYLSPSAVFQNTSSTIVTGTPLTGGNGGDGAVNILIPLYAVWDVSDRIKVGLGINSPFGLKTKYNDTWVGRYYAIDSELNAININPTLAAKLTDNLSVLAICRC